MTAHDQATGEYQIQELSDRRHPCEQTYSDCLNKIFASLEEIDAKYERISAFNQALVNHENHFLQIISRLEECLRLCQEERSALQLTHQTEVARLAEETRLRDLGIRQLQQELAQQSLNLVNAQADLAYLRSSHPKARAKQLLERFGFLVKPLLPISLRRRGKRVVRKFLKG